MKAFVYTLLSLAFSIGCIGYGIHSLYTGDIRMSLVRSVIHIHFYRAETPMAFYISVVFFLVLGGWVFIRVIQSWLNQECQEEQE